MSSNPQTSLRSAKSAPPGWSASLIEHPSRPTLICLTRDIQTAKLGGCQVMHHLFAAQARALARNMRAAIDAFRKAPPVSSRWRCETVYDTVGAPWSIHAYRNGPRDVINLEGWMGTYPGNRIGAKHPLSLGDAKHLADAIELLALMDAPLPIDLPRGVDANPERELPGYVPEFLKATAQEGCHAD